MQYIRKELSREDYTRYKEMPRTDFIKEISEVIPIDWKCGYGWYGAALAESDGKFYIVHTIGSSCD